MNSKELSKGQKSEKRTQCFNAKLKQIIGVQKKGNPESKRRLRHNVCPKCTMKVIGEVEADCGFSRDYLFACICMEQSLANYSEIRCGSSASDRVVEEMMNKSCTYFNMVCECSTQDVVQKSTILWKPLKKSTWNRNNQPTCDNIRITAVQTAFITIGHMACGDIELHVTGPKMIKRKPYGRLGAGINMVSGKDWIPSMMYMISENDKNAEEEDKLKQELKFVLKFPPHFQGKINVKFFGQRCDSGFITLFNLDTSSLGYQIVGDVDAIENGSEEKEDQCYPSNNKVEDTFMADKKRRVNDDNNSVYSYTNNNDKQMSSPMSPRKNMNNMQTNDDVEMVDESTSANSEKVNSFTNSPQFLSKCLHFLAECITTGNLLSFRNFGLAWSSSVWQYLLLCPNQLNENCLHVIARHQALPFYEYLERVFTPDGLLNYFCQPVAGRIPFQLLFGENDDALLNYVVKMIHARGHYLILRKLLCHQNRIDRFVLIDAILFEKVHFLQTISVMLNECPSLLSAQEFIMMCEQDQSVERIIAGCNETLQNYVCFWGYCDQERNKKHQPHCKVPDVVKALSSIKKQLMMK